MKQKKTKQERRKNEQESGNTGQQRHQSVNPEERKLKIDNKYNLLFIFAIFITGIIAYSNSFDCSFHFDDRNVFHSVVNDINVLQSSVKGDSASIVDWLRLFPTRPIGILTFAINYNIHGLNLWGYHLVNLIIHLINAFLVWWLTWLTLSTPVMKDTQISRHKTMMAFLTGLLFVTHPLATQSVTYIAQRFASLATLFYLLSLILFVQGKLWQRDKKVPWFLFGGSIVCAVLGMLTKEIVFTLPFTILLFDYCFLKTIPWKLEIQDKGLIISFIMLVIFILLYFSFSPVSPVSIFNPVAPDQGYSYSISMKEYFLTQFSVILTYIRLFILPLNQNFDYDYPLSSSFFQLKTFLSFSLLLGILATGILMFKRYRLISFGIFWFFLTISVESSIIPISQNVIFEHRTYLPGFGFFLALTGAFFYFFKGRYLKIAVIILLMVAALNTALTYQRNKVWKNEYTLWGDCLKKSPDKERSNENFGRALFAEGKLEDAIDHYNKAIRITPDYAYVYNSRGAAYAKLGQYQLAFEDFNKAIRLKPDYAESYYNKGIAYTDLGQYQPAIENFNKTILLKPNYADAYNNRGALYSKLGQYQLAIENYNQIIRLKPDDADAYFNRGKVYFELGQHQSAIENYNEAIRLNREYIYAYNSRGNVYVELGQRQRAIESYNEAIRLKPDFAIAYNNRGTAYNELGQYKLAIDDFNKAISLDENYADAYSNRASVYFNQGNKKLSCYDAQKACDLGHCKVLEIAKVKGLCR
jgi:tetratricopeptide (TPR) repeat protein